MSVKGAMERSYIRGNSIHHSYNRAIALSNTDGLLIEWNVAYHIKGHAIYLNTGGEAKNKILKNLVVNVMISWSL